MSNLNYLLKQRNRFSKSDIEELSSYLFKIAYIDKNQPKEKQVSILKNFIEISNETLYSDSVSTKKEKVSIIKKINKLTTQLEILELLNNEQKQSDLKTTAEQFGKKTQSSIKPLK